MEKGGKCDEKLCVGGQVGDEEKFILCLFLSYLSKGVQSSLPIEIIVRAFVLITGHLKNEGNVLEFFLGGGGRDGR